MLHEEIKQRILAALHQTFIDGYNVDIEDQEGGTLRAESANGEIALIRIKGFRLENLELTPEQGATIFETIIGTPPRMGIDIEVAGIAGMGKLTAESLADVMYFISRMREPDTPSLEEVQAEVERLAKQLTPQGEWIPA